MKVLILTSCSKKKKYERSNALVTEILKKNNLPYPTSNVDLEDQYQQCLSHFVENARRMYLGSFLYVDKLYNELKKKNTVDFKIISARYGLIDAKDQIIPYDFSFNSLKKNERYKRANTLNIYNTLILLLESTKYDLTIVILGKEYLDLVYHPKENIDFTNYLSSNLILFGPKLLLDTIRYDKTERIYVRAIGDRNKKIIDLKTRLAYMNSYLVV